MKLKNYEIYNIVEGLKFSFDDSSKYLPVKVNFALQKNFSKFLSLAQEIENLRMSIGKEYGTQNGDSYQINPENFEKAKKEMDDLMNIEQEVKIRMIKESDLEGFDLTMAQMSAILFMIEEEE